MNFKNKSKKMLAASVMSVLLATALGSTAFAMYIGPNPEPDTDTDTGTDSIIIGNGGHNTASGERGIIVGGDQNTASGRGAVVVGSESNEASGINSGVFGGRGNEAGGQQSVVAGGNSNRITATGGVSSIFGGRTNLADASTATIVGADNAHATGELALVAGGYGGQAAGDHSVSIGGGATGSRATRSVAMGDGSYVSASNAMALGQGAVATEAGTVSFGHNAGDPYVAVASGNNNYTNSTYSSGSYNRLVKVGYGQNAHDAATVDQLSKVTSNDGSVQVTDTQDPTTGRHTYNLSVDTGRFGQEITNLSGRVSKLNNRINKVGAGAAALAALHPLDFDPDSKWDFAAGYGNYRNANAVAVGAFYRPNEDTMFSVGGAFGNGENMVNAGLSLKIGSGNHVSTSRVAMAKEIRDMKKTIDEISAQNARMAAIINALVGTNLNVDKSAMFPDVPENHWAYDAVKCLADNGLVHGYPDGMFHGDRTLTRYEFAQVVYNAIEAGAKVDQRLVNEFEPELKYIRVDTVLKDKNGNPVIERVRTVKQN